MPPPRVTPAHVQVEEQEQLLSNVSMDSVDWEAAGVPQGFRRLRSPRAHPTRPDTAARRAQAQIDRLPLLFADHFDGHITDLRELLDADVWADVQRCARCLLWSSACRCGLRHAPGYDLITLRMRDVMCFYGGEGCAAGATTCAAPMCVPA